MAASVPEDQRFCFIGEWYDLQAELVRSYYLFYYPVDSSVELVRLFDGSLIITIESDYYNNIIIHSLISKTRGHF